jgi:hypothetical protein
MLEQAECDDDDNDDNNNYNNNNRNNNEDKTFMTTTITNAIRIHLRAAMRWPQTDCKNESSAADHQLHQCACIERVSCDHNLHVHALRVPHVRFQPSLRVNCELWWQYFGGGGDDAHHKANAMASMRQNKWRIIQNMISI